MLDKINRTPSSRSGLRNSVRPLTVGRSLLIALIAISALLLAACSTSIASIFNTATPAATFTLTPSLTPTPTNTPTPTPTPEPIVRVQEADHELFNGNWDGAMSLYNAALNQQPDPAVAAAARYGLGMARIHANDLEGAAGDFTLYLQAYPTDSRIPDAYFQLGFISQSQGAWAVAIQNYEQYLTLRPGKIESYVWERIAECYLELGDTQNALEAYNQAILSDRAGGLAPLIEAKANLLASQGDYAEALAQYELVANSSESRLTLARMDILRGRMNLQLGNTETAYEFFQHAVDTYPDTYDAYQSLIALIDAGIPVSELQRGIVNYHAGQYQLALAAFNRYIEATDVPDASVYWYAALSRRALEQYVGAFANFDVIISDYPDSDYWADAWLEKAYTQWAWADDYAGAVTTLQTFAVTAPANAQAPTALFQAGRIAERQRNLAKAAEIWSSINSLYPDSSEAAEGAFFAGIAFYREANYQSAAIQFATASEHPAATVDRRSAAYMWLAKTQRLRGEMADATTAFDQAVAADPGGYYSLRAIELRDDLPPFPPTLGYDFSFDYVKEKAEAEAWLASQLGIEASGDLGAMSPQLAAEGSWIRGSELWRLGQTADAKTEFDNLRISHASDALGLYQMALAFRNLGLYAHTIRAARASLDALGIVDTFSAPAFFTHLRFGPYYNDLITKWAKEYDVDPLMMYAIIRQESLFEGTITSSAAAQGLMQIIPDTGTWIAQRLNRPNYQNSDLFRPFINVEFGSYYLDVQRKYFDGDMFAALAAYNAGPGNAEIWLSAADNDPDLFLEIVRIDEPRRYIRAIYEFYELYRAFYGVTQ